MKYETPDMLIKEWRRLTPYIHSRGIKIMTKMVMYCVNYQCFDWIPELWSSELFILNIKCVIFLKERSFESINPINFDKNMANSENLQILLYSL